MGARIGRERGLGKERKRSKGMIGRSSKGLNGRIEGEGRELKEILKKETDRRKGLEERRYMKGRIGKRD